MNIYVILIGALLIVLMVAFGRNPIQEARDAKAHRAGDPLVNAIADHNAQGHMSNGFGMLPGGNTSAGVSRPSGYPAYTNPTQNSPAPAYQKPQTNSYYPPPPAGTLPAPLQQPRQNYP